MATKNVTSVSLDATPLTGITRFTVRMSRTVSPVHVDGDAHNSCATSGSFMTEGSLEGVDVEQMEAKDGAEVTEMIVLCPAADGGGTAKTFTLDLVKLHSFELGVPEPGEAATATLQFTAISSDGALYPLEISNTP